MHVSHCPTVDPGKPIKLLFVIGNTIYGTGYNYRELIGSIWNNRGEIWTRMKHKHLG